MAWAAVRPVLIVAPGAETMVWAVLPSDLVGCCLRGPAAAKATAVLPVTCAAVVSVSALVLEVGEEEVAAEAVGYFGPAR